MPSRHRNHDRRRTDPGHLVAIFFFHEHIRTVVPTGIGKKKKTPYKRVMHSLIFSAVTRCSSLVMVFSSASMLTRSSAHNVWSVTAMHHNGVIKKEKKNKILGTRTFDVIFLDQVFELVHLGLERYEFLVRVRFVDGGRRVARQIGHGGQTFVRQ